MNRLDLPDGWYAIAQTLSHRRKIVKGFISDSDFMDSVELEGLEYTLSERYSPEDFENPEVVEFARRFREICREIEAWIEKKNGDRP